MFLMIYADAHFFHLFLCRCFQSTGWQFGTLAQECLQRPEGELDEELADFLKHCQISPGRPYKAPEIFESRLNQDVDVVIVQIEIVRTVFRSVSQADRVGHKLLLLKALRSPELRVMWRSDVEAFTQHRYITEPQLGQLGQLQ